MPERSDWSEVTSAWERVLGDLGEIGNELTESFREAWQESGDAESDADAAATAAEAGAPPSETRDEIPDEALDETRGETQGEARDADAPLEEESGDVIHDEPAPSDGAQTWVHKEADESAASEGNDPFGDLTDTVDRSFHAVRSMADRAGKRIGESGRARDLSRSFEGAIKLTLALIAQLLLRLSDRLNDPLQTEAGGASAPATGQTDESSGTPAPETDESSGTPAPETDESSGTPAPDEEAGSAHAVTSPDGE